MKHLLQKSTLMTIFFGLLPVCFIVLSLIINGLQNFYQYQVSVQPDQDLSWDVLHFFIKQEIKQKINELTVEDLPASSPLPVFWLYADEKDIEQLNADLPRSGKTLFVNGYLKTSNIMDAQKIQFRYRGGLAFHWLFDKKSFRIKLDDYQQIDGDQQFNLVIPVTKYVITDWLVYDIARSWGLITPDFYPVRVLINNQYNGLHFYLSQTDESLVRKQKRMPGSIYVGDNFYNPELPGTASIIFTDNKTALPLLWTDSLLWDKKAARNSESKSDRSDIKKFIAIVNLTDPVQFYAAFKRYFDTEKYFQYFAIDTFFGSHHHDYFHNHKLYFDPYKGKFEPIEWDVRYWRSIFMLKDFSNYPLLEQVQRNPVLEYQRDRVGFELLQKYPLESLKKIVQSKYNTLFGDLLADPYKRYQDTDYQLFIEDKSVLQTNTALRKDRQQLFDIAKSRYQYLYRLYNSASVQVKAESVDAETVELVFSIDKNSPVLINWQPFLDMGLTPTPFLNQQAQLSVDTQLLYPGRKRRMLGNNQNGVKTLGNDYAFPAPLHYRFRIYPTTLTAIMPVIGQLNATNAITGKQVAIQLVDQLPSVQETISIHPWRLTPWLDLPKQTIRLSGHIVITEDTVYSATDQVVIEPGTQFSLAPGKSLFFYGRVLALGTQKQPIVFQRQDVDKPWGSLVIQGQAASKSQFRYIHLTGGSVASRQLIHYPGQFNIHDVSDFKLSQCYIADNTIGDDALHIAYSQGSITDCRFKNTAMDAVDIDISTVSIKNSVVIDSGNDGIDAMNSSITISNNDFNGSGDKCLSLGEGTRAKLINNRLKNCQIGIAVKDASRAELHHLYFINKSNPSIALYQKNTRYNLGGTITGKDIYGISLQDIEISQRSTNHIPNTEFKPLNMTYE